ncbi:hypothetical protein J7L48_08815 [bacterium]|nr:hypothetical protein [bacterium]
MQYKNIKFDENTKAKIYLTTLEKIVNYESKKAKRTSFFGVMAISFAVVILLLNLLFIIPKNNNKTSTVTAKNENTISLEDEFVKVYGEFFDFSDDDNGNDLLSKSMKDLENY